MLTVGVAHVREQGHDMIIVPLDASFGERTTTQQNAAIAAIRRAAASAGMQGTIVIFWEDASGRMNFLGPLPSSPFLQEIDMRWIAANINRQLIW
jgi:hypothetical protein